MRRDSSALFGLAAILFTTNFCSGQANINEGLETAYIYVDGTTGSDSNPGTQASPLQTIGAAAAMAEANNQGGIGSRVTINPGTYRESVSLNHSPRDTSLPITFEAASNGTVIVSGATVYTGWTKYAPNPSIYTNAWLNQWGTCPQISICPFQQDIMMRREMVAVNGTVLTQVLSLTQMQPGTFYVDEDGALIYVWPPAKTDMRTALVEAASLPSLFQITRKSNIVVRGLTFQYANSCRDSAAVSVLGSSSNILFDSDTFQWNNSQGLKIAYPSTYFTVENSVAQENGQTGYQEEQTLYGWWQSDKASYNNWRGAQAAFYGCNTGGFHASLAHIDTIDSLTAAFNETYGIHWDTDNANIAATKIDSTGNLLSGALAEKDEGPISISYSYFCNQDGPLGGAGLLLRNSEQVLLTKSVLLNNLPAQIMVIGQPGGIEVINWQTGVATNLFTQNLTNTWNTIQGNTGSQLVFKDKYLGGFDWTAFQSTLKSSHNTWWNALNSTTPFDLPTPTANTKDDFSGWQSATLADFSSSFAAPSGNPGAACNLTPVGTNFWFTINSALLTVSPGGSASYTLTLTPLNFTGTVNLTLDGIAEVNGLSATLSPSSITTSGTSVLTVTAATTTAAGTYSITVIANSGNLTRTVTTQLTVN